MFKNKKQLLVVPIFAALTSILSLNYQNRVSSEGFFSVYQGPTYTGKGWPWMYFKIYESGGTSLDFNLILLTFVFWVVVGVILYLLFKGAFYLISKLANFDSKNKKS